MSDHTITWWTAAGTAYKGLAWLTFTSRSSGVTVDEASVFIAEYPNADITFDRSALPEDAR